MTRTAWNKGKPNPWSEEAKANLRASMATPDSKEKRSSVHIGQIAWNKGRTSSYEERQKTSESTKRGMTNEVKRKVSEALSGRKNPQHSLRLRGRKLSEEHKRKIAAGFANHPANCTCHPHNLMAMRIVSSKEQLKLAEILKRAGFLLRIEEKFGRKSVDIYLVEFHIAVEYDGIYWHQDKEKDIKRDAYLLEKFNLPTIRFTKSDLEGAEEAILRKLDAPRLRRIIEGRL